MAGFPDVTPQVSGLPQQQVMEHMQVVKREEAPRQPTMPLTWMCFCCEPIEEVSQNIQALPRGVSEDLEATRVIQPRGDAPGPDEDTNSQEVAPTGNPSKSTHWMDCLMCILFAPCCCIHAVFFCGYEGTCCWCLPNCESSIIQYLPTPLQVYWYRLRTRWTIDEGALLLLREAPNAAKCDRTCVLTAVNRWGHALEYAADPFKNDKDVVLVAVSNNGKALEYASESIRSDKEVTFVAFRNTGVDVEDHLSLKDLYMAAVQKDGNILRYATDLREDKDVVLAAVTQSGNALEYVDKTSPMWNNKDFVLSMVKLNGPTLKYAKGGLNQDPDCLKASGLWGTKAQISYSNQSGCCNTDMENIFVGDERLAAHDRFSVRVQVEI